MKPDNITFDRKRYEEAYNYYAKHGLAPQTSQLRFEQELEKGKGVYEFIVNREGLKRVTEMYLKRNDLFVVKGIYVGLMVETDSLKGHAPIYTYPVLESELPDNSPYKGFKNNHAEAIYNGTMSIMTGQTANFQSLPLRRFRHVPENQSLPQFFSDDVLLNLPERLAFAGTQDQKITISFPYTPNTDPTPKEETEKAYLVVYVDGWLIEGGTNDKFKTTDNPYGAAI